MTIHLRMMSSRKLAKKAISIAHPAIAIIGISFIAGCQSASPQPSMSEFEMANLDKAVHCMELLELHHDLERAGRECFADDYIQHHPRFPNGKEAVLEALARRLQNNPDKTISIKRTAVNGDLVWIHLHSQRFPGDEQGNAVVNIFRMQDGRFAEHWGVVQAVPEESANNNTMF